MIGTFQALVIALVAILPGALYTIARENFGATWAWRQTDTATQIFRFLSASAIFHAVFAPLTFVAYKKLVITHALTEGHRQSPETWDGPWRGRSCGMKIGSAVAPGGAARVG